MDLDFESSFKPARKAATAAPGLDFEPRFAARPTATAAAANPATAVAKKPERTWGEAAKDTALGIGQGVVNLAGNLAEGVEATSPTGIARNLVGLARRVVPSANLPNIPSSAQLAADAATTLAGREPVSMPTSAEAFGAATNKITENLSPALQAEKQELAQTEGFFGSAKKVLTSPRLLAQFTAEQIPNLATLGTGSRMSAAGAVTGVVDRALAGGATREAAEALGRQAAKEGAEKFIVGANVGLESGAASQQAQQDALSLPDEVWAGNEQYRAMLARGVDPMTAKRDLSQDSALVARLVGGVSGFVGGKIAAPFEADVFTRNLARRPVALLQGAGREAAEEAVQEGGSQLGTNLAVAPIDRERGILDGVAQAAGTGAALGGVMGGGIALGGALAARPQPKVVQPGPMARAADPAAPAIIEPAARPFPNAAPGSLSEVANLVPAAPPPLPGQTDGSTNSAANEAAKKEPKTDVPLPPLAPAPPWVDAETGVMRDPQDSEIEEVMHSLINSSLAGGSGITPRVLKGVLREQMGVPSDRLAPLLAKVKKDRQDGFTSRPPEEVQPDLEQVLLDQVTGSGRPEPEGMPLEPSSPTSPKALTSPSASAATLVPASAASPATQPAAAIAGQPPIATATQDRQPPQQAADRKGGEGGEGPSAQDTAVIDAPQTSSQAEAGTSTTQPQALPAIDATSQQSTAAQAVPVVETEAEREGDRPEPAPVEAAAVAQALASSESNPPATAESPASQTPALAAPNTEVAGAEVATASPPGTPAPETTQPAAVAAAAAEAATSPTNDLPDATPAQREAGNFKVGRAKINGHDISIEYPAGVKRKPHHKELTRAYGYIRRTEAKDGDKIDVFLGERADDTRLPVFVVDQVDAAGKYDEAKVIMGEANEADARKAYLSNYPPKWKGIGAITQMSHEEFKEWVQDPARTKKPAGKLQKSGTAVVSPKPARAAPAVATAEAPPVAGAPEIKRAGPRVVSPKPSRAPVPATVEPPATPPAAQPKRSGPAVVSPKPSRTTPPAPPAAPAAVEDTPRVRVRNRKPYYDVADRDTLRAYFKPGRVVKGYSGHDRVLSFDVEGNDWSVRVIGVNEDGSPKKGEVERVHHTAPDRAALASIFGPPRKVPAKAKAAVTREPGAVDRGRSSGEPLDVRGTPGSEPSVSESTATTNAEQKSFSRVTDPSGGTGLPIARAQELKRELTKDWGDNGPSVILVESAEDFPASAKADPAYARAEGLYDGRPVVWLNLSRIPTESRFAQVLAHEAIGHYGVERLVGAEEWESIVAAIENLASAEGTSQALQAVFADVRKRYGDLDRTTFAKESIAVMAERGIRNSFVARVLAAVRRFLRRVMPSLTWSETDIRDLLGQSDSFLRAGRNAAQREATVQAYSFSRPQVDGRGQRFIEREGGTFVQRGDQFYLADAAGKPRDFLTLSQAQEAATISGSRVEADPNEGARRTWSVVLENGAELSRVALFSRPNAEVIDDLDAIRESLTSDSVLERAKQRLGELTPAKVKDGLRQIWLGALTTRHLTELGGDYFSNIRHYNDYLAEMQADRNKLQADAESIVERARKWAGKNREAAKAMFDVMHEATIDGVDPAEEYKVLQFRYSGQLHDATPKKIKEALNAIRMQIRERSGDNKTDMYEEAKQLRAMPARERARARKYAPLVAKWNALPPEAQQIYREFRDAYASRSDQLEKALVARINDTDAEAGHKRKLIDVIRRQFESNRLQGVYFPLQRFGKYFVAAEKSGVATFQMFERLADMTRTEKGLRDRGFTITGRGLKDQGKAKDAPSGTFVAEIMEKLNRAGVSDKTQDEIYQIYLQSLPEMSMRKHAIHRKSIPGFDNDGVRAFAYNMHHGSHQLARLRFSHKLDAVLTVLKQQQKNLAKDAGSDTSKIVAGDAILQELDRRHEWIMNPTDSALTNVISSVGFTYYLGLTPAASLVNLTQNALVTYPYLASRFGGIKAMNYMLAAFKDSGRTLGHIQKTLTDPDEQRAHAALQVMGALDKTQAHNLAGIAEGGMQGYNPAWSKAMEIIGWGFHKTEVINRETTGIAAYRLARADGQSFDEAIKTASEAIWETHFDYSNANRARFMQSGTAKALLMFKQYSLNMTWHLGRMAWQATKGQTPEVKKIARRNLAGILGMSSLFSGVLGLPMSGVVMGALNAIQATFGDDDEPWEAETEFRAFLVDLLGADAADVLLRGGVNAATGADIAGRTGLSELWFRDADKELEGRGYYYNLLEQAAGPMGGVLKNAIVGKNMIDEGHTWRGVETMLPKALKDVMKGARYATQGVNTLRGDPLVDDSSLYDTLLQVNGFTPAKVASQYERNRELGNYEQHILDRRQALMDGFAMALRTGDNDARAALVGKIQAFNSKNPEVAISSASIRRSIQARARYSAKAEAGMVINQKLKARLTEAVPE